MALQFSANRSATLSTSRITEASIQFLITQATTSLNSLVVEAAASADLAQDAADTAIGANGFTDFSTRTEAIAATIPTGKRFLRTAGYASVGDLGGALYEKVNSEPSHAGKLQSADGAWWEIAENDVNIAMFGAKGDGSTDDTAAIQAAVDYCQARALPGGVVIVPANFRCKITDTILISSPNVIIRGRGSNQSSTFGPDAQATSEFVWYGAVGGTMLKVATPSNPSGSVIADSGVERIKLDGRGIAAIGFYVFSVRRGTFLDLYVDHVTGAAYKVSCGISGVDCVSPSDTQNCRFDRCFFRLVDGGTQTAIGMQLTGSTIGNTSGNVFIDCNGLHWDGSAFQLENADNNIFIRCSAFHIGVGYAFDLWGGIPGASTGGSGNVFIHPGWADIVNGCILRGTDDVRFLDSARDNVFEFIDSLNNSAPIVAGTGCTYSYSNTQGDTVRGGKLRSSSRFSAMGYDTGAGGSVTQLTSKSTDVTLNKPSGTIVMNNSNLNAGDLAVFNMNNDTISQQSTVTVNVVDDGSLADVFAYNIWVSNVRANGVRFLITNRSGAPHAEPVRLQFNVINGVTA